MTPKEMRLRRIESLNRRFSQIYESIEIDDRTCFILSSGVVCRIDNMGAEYNALVIEYADNLEMAQKGLFGEDGDLFFMEELKEDEMFNGMLNEINNVFN